MSTPKKVIRIKADPKNPTEKFINVKLDQDFEEIQILSLTLKQSDVYRSFNADYGVLIGRVQSSSVGLPNCKVSVFIPISDEDSAIPELLSIYPFTKSTDEDKKGKRFNLFNKLKKLNPFSGYKENNYGFGYLPKTPVGSIPDKVEVLTNETWVEVYDKYYKFTTVTNQSGEYCLFGVPVGAQNIHMDCDITDIGKFSTTIPILSQVLGLSPTFFNDNGTKIIPSNDLSNIPTLQSQDASVEVKPFWGDKTSGSYEIGITRHDFNISTKIVPSFTLMGAGITQGENSFWGNRIIFNAVMGLKNLCIKLGDCNSFNDTQGSEPGVKVRFCLGLHLKFLKRTIIDINIGNASNDNCGGGTFSFKLCIYIVVGNILPFLCVDAFRFASCTMNGGEFEQDPISIKWLGKTSLCSNNCTTLQTQAASNYDDFTTLMNLDDCRVGEISTKIYRYKENVSDNDILNNNVDINNDLQRLATNQFAKVQSDNGTFLYQIPCNRRRIITDEFGNEVETDDVTTGIPTEFCGFAHFSIEDLDIKTSGGKINVGRTKIKVPQCEDYNGNSWVKSAYFFQSNEVYSVSQFMSVAGETEPFKSKHTGLLLDVNTFGQTNPELYGDDLQMVSNNTISLFNGTKISNIFSNQWLNGCLFFVQAAYKKRKGKKRDYYCNVILGDNEGGRTRDNDRPIGAGDTNNKYFLNGKYFQTNFIQLDKDQLVDILAVPNTRRGVTINDLNGTYMNTKSSGIKYFYKGIFSNSDFIKNLKNRDVL